MQRIDLSGTWQCTLPGFAGPVRVPGTLDENGIGAPDALRRPWHPDESTAPPPDTGGPIATRLTRKHTCTGPAVFARTLAAGDLAGVDTAGRRVFLEVERARQLSLRLNGRAVPHFGPNTLSAPHVFELTGRLTGQDTLELTSDNSYPGWPAGAILDSSAATDETQTNWNGLLGYCRLTVCEPVFIENLRVYPRGGALDVCAVVSADRPWQGELTLASDALAAPAALAAGGPVGRTEVWLRGLPLAPDVRRWDLEEGNLYALTAALGADRVTVRFGVREFCARDGRFTLNGRTVFLRGEANCAVWPESGHTPMDVESWRRALQTYRSYGVNTVRFHSHCPPDAAFTAADELGMLLQPELSHWDPKHAFAAPESRRYYAAELRAVLAAYADHPSFVMLSLGNELCADADGRRSIAELLQTAKAYDPTRLYCGGSNNHHGRETMDAGNDYYTAFAWRDLPLRATSAGMEGWLNDPDAAPGTDYRAAVQSVHEVSGVPVCSFEVGQYEILPDFGQLDDFNGVTLPENLRLIQQRAADRGLLADWPRYAAASGELALLCYRAEAEAALRTPGLGGISLLGLQDFPGQGTALVGMLDSHLRPKPYAFARPERFRAFFTDALPLARLPRTTFFAGETLAAEAEFANYGKQDIAGTPEWTLAGGGARIQGVFAPVTARRGGLTTLGKVTVPLAGFAAPAKLTLTVRLAGFENAWDLWVYPETMPVCPPDVYECRSLDARARAVLAAGGRVLLAPPADGARLPGAVRGQFSTDFWSVGTFPQQAGGMGYLIENDHPLFQNFPTGFHTDWQWRRLARAFALPLPAGAAPLVTQLDSFAFLRRLSPLFEGRCCGGRLLISSFGLQDLLRYPEARALQSAVYRYMASPDFAPAGEIDLTDAEALVRA